MAHVVRDGDGERLALLVRMTRQVTARHDLDDVLSETFRCLRDLLEFSGGSIQLLDDDGYIRMAAADPAPPPEAMAHRVPLGTSVAGRVILTEQPVYLPDIGAVTAAGGGRGTSSGVRSYLGVPLLADGHAIGLLQVDSAEPDAWSARDLLFFASVAPIVAAAIQNARTAARAAASRARVDTVEARLRAGSRLLPALRRAAAAGRPGDVTALLDRLDRVLAGDAAVLPAHPRDDHHVAASPAGLAPLPPAPLGARGPVAVRG